MKIIEALKKIKDLQRKADDLQQKVATHCADYSVQTPIYPDQKEQISLWLQAHGDIAKEILSLRYAIQKTNIATNVTIELGGVQVTKTIAEWIHRRKDLAKLEEGMWRKLTDRGLQEMGVAKHPQTQENTLITRRLYFDPKERDKKIELYRSEPSIIDGTLEVINAVTDLVK